MIGSEDVEPVIRAENFRAGMRDSIASNDFKAIALKMLEYEEYFIKEGQNSEMGKIILQTGLDSIYQQGFYFKLLFFSFLFFSFPSSLISIYIFSPQSVFRPFQNEGV